MATVRVPCPTCARETLADDSVPLPAAFPFCSARCRLLDLGKWADGQYRIAGAAQRPDVAESADDGT